MPTILSFDDLLREVALVPALEVAIVGATDPSVLEGMVEATDVPGEKFCTACFSSKYPIPVPEHVAVTKHMLEEPPVVGGQLTGT